MMMKSKESNDSILIVANSLSGGGAEKSMLALHEKFIENNVNSYFLTLNRDVNSLKEVKNVIALDRKCKSGFKETALKLLTFKKIVVNMAPKVMILNCELPELYGAFLFPKSCRIICVEHTSFPWRKRRILGLITRTILKAKKVEWVTVIKGQKSIWVGSRNPKHIPNPYIRINSNITKQNISSALVFIGGLKEGKRPEWVVKAGLKQNLEVNVYGDGPLKNSLESKYQNDLELIKFHGFKIDVWEQISKKSLVIVPSEFEGDGMVVVEAILSGHPIALAKNEDLLRFELDNKHYFSDLDGLISLVEKNSFNHFSDLKVSNEIFDNLEVTRSLNRVYSQWTNFLQIKKSRFI
jgi:hypothetical protein